MDKVEVTKCQNGYLVQLDGSVHVVAGFNSHALLGNVIAEALGVLAPKKERKSRAKKQLAPNQQESNLYPDVP